MNKIPVFGPFSARIHIRKRLLIFPNLQRIHVHTSELHMSPKTSESKTKEGISSVSAVVRRNKGSNSSIRKKRYSCIERIRLELISSNQLFAIWNEIRVKSESAYSDGETLENLGTTPFFGEEMNKIPMFGPFSARIHIRKRLLIFPHLQRIHVHTSELHMSPKTSESKTKEGISSVSAVVRRNTGSNSSIRKKRYSCIERIRLELISSNQSFDSIRNEIRVKSESASSDGETLEKLDTTPFFGEIKKEVHILDDKEWLLKETHVFVLSFAGKPIYSLQGHGSEDQMGSLFALIHCFISTGQDRNDNITSIEADGMRFVFLVRNALYLVAASRNNLSVRHLQSKLSEVYEQILFLLTYSKLNNIFTKQPSYDLRKQLFGTNKLFNSLLINNKISNNVFTFLNDSIEILPLSEDVRSGIANVIKKKCHKIRNLVFALLVADSKLIALVRMKKYSLGSADMRLLFNFIEYSKSTMKHSKLWMPPVCLPNFDFDGFLYAYISYISKSECNAFLILLSVDPDMFYVFSQIHRNIAKSLHSRSYLSAINTQQHSRLNLKAMGIPGLRHFIYKRKNLQEVFCSDIFAPYTIEENFLHLKALYYDLHDRVHTKSPMVKLIYEKKEKEVAVVSVTRFSELYAIFDPFVDKGSVVSCIAKLEKWFNKSLNVFFIRSFPIF